MIDKITIRVQPTTGGKGEYVQIMSGDTVTVNIVLVAGKIEVLDQRKKKP